ncbi:MAG: hypothetical protein AAGA54_14150 [Myxococcota bacterium]
MNYRDLLSLLALALPLAACQSSPSMEMDDTDGDELCEGIAPCNTGAATTQTQSTGTTGTDEPDGGDTGSSESSADDGDDTSSAESTGEEAAPCSDPDTAAFRICPTDESGAPGDAGVLLGMSIQEPDRTDMNGDTIDESAAGPRWMELPRAFFRFPAGTDSYTLTTWDAPEVVYFLEEFRGKYPGVPNDQTWPPQLPIEDFANWLHEDVQRITLGNEPPLHADPFPDGFPTGDSYVEFAASIIDAYPEYEDHFWIQTGKPEVLRYDALGPAGLARHADFLDTASAAVAAGILPPRITTTHKLLDDYPGDRLDFYRELVTDYQTYFGEEVEICFQEYKYKADEMLSLGSLLRVAEFMLVMSRLRHEHGATISGGAFQQGFASGTSNLIGLDDQGTPEWTETGLTDLWELFGSSLTTGAFVQTQQLNRPEAVQIELFEGGGRQYLLYSNTSTDDIELELDIGPEGGEVERIDDDLALELDTYSGVLPAESAGRIRVR